MIRLGRSGGQEKLLDGHFEAWDYGPVEPNVYKRVCGFGAEAIRDIFSSPPIPNQGADALLIDEACNFLLTKTPGELVAITHWPNGAWAKNYVPGRKHILITDSDIFEEYTKRFS